MQRIMVRNVDHFDSYKDVTVWHIPHEYSEQSKIKSEVVSIQVADCRSITLIAYC